MAQRDLQFDDGKSQKFWKIKLSGTSHTVTFGRIGTTGQSRTKDFASKQEAKTSYDKLIKQKVEALRVGKDIDFDVDLGAMTTQRQVSTVTHHLEDALSKGAVMFARSSQAEDENSGNVIPAVVLTEVTHEMLLMREETFGPILGIMKVRDMEEAVALANDSNLGLTGSVWSKDRRQAEKLGRQIQAGVVMINDHLMSHGLAETPWGGTKQSGCSLQSCQR